MVALAFFTRYLCREGGKGAVGEKVHNVQTAFSAPNRNFNLLVVHKATSMLLDFVLWTTSRLKFLFDGVFF